MDCRTPWLYSHKIGSCIIFVRLHKIALYPQFIASDVSLLADHNYLAAGAVAAQTRGRDQE